MLWSISGDCLMDHMSAASSKWDLIGQVAALMHLWEECFPAQGVKLFAPKTWKMCRSLYSLGRHERTLISSLAKYAFSHPAEYTSLVATVTTNIHGPSPLPASWPSKVGIHITWGPACQLKGHHSSKHKVNISLWTHQERPHSPQNV